VIELLVVGSVVFILAAVLFPAIRRAQDAARRTQCANNLHQIGLALDHYHADMNMFPPGCVDFTGPVPNQSVGYQLGWIVQLLPKLDQHNLYQMVDFSKGVHHSANAGVSIVQIPPFVCPSNDQNSAIVPGSSYAGCIGGSERMIDIDSSGVMFLNSSISRRQIPDGLSDTIVVGETRFHKGLTGLGLGWTSGSAATLRSTAWPINGEIVDEATDECGGFGSYHGDFAMFLFADRSVRPLSADIDPLVLQHLGDRQDGELISARTAQDDVRDQRRAEALQERREHEDLDSD